MSQRLKVLVIDEHRGSMHVLVYALRSRGYSCEGVASVSDALKRIGSLQPDVVLYEWNVGGGAGRGLASRLRSASKHGVAKVIAVSTLDEPDGFRDAECVNAYLTKPFDVDQLEAVLRP